ncbi:MAG: hypothetical protein WCK75_05550 [Elusimicrobiota bacterium]
MVTKKFSIAFMLGLFLTFVGSHAFADQVAYNQLLDATNASTSFNVDILIAHVTASDILHAAQTSTQTAVAATPAAAMTAPLAEAPSTHPVTTSSAHQAATSSAHTSAASAPAAAINSVPPAIAAAIPTPPSPQEIKDFVHEHKPIMAMGALGAYLGFALMGPAGILVGAIFMVGFMMVANA